MASLANDGVIVLNPASIFGGKPGSFEPHQSYRMLLDNFGTPDNPNPITPEAAANVNLRPDDIIGQYINRELVMVSDAITAAVMNDRASVMTDVIFPKIETLETSFSVQTMEPNNVPYSRVTNYGIPREVSYTEYAEAYTTQRKKQMARIELNFLLDPNYGPKYIRMLLSTLASNAKLTLNVDAINQVTDQPFRNKYYSIYKKEKFDHNQLFNDERYNFGLANKDHQMFFNELRRFGQDETEFPFDTILGPAGIFAVLKQGIAESGGNIEHERIEALPETKRIQRILYKTGSKSEVRMNIGGRNVDAIGIAPLQTNMRDRTDKIFKPFVTTTTVCEVIPFDVGTAHQTPKNLSTDALDVYAYNMTPTSGRQERMEFIEALKATFLYDLETGAPSALYTNFAQKQNAAIRAGRLPNPADTEEWRHATSADDEDDFGTDKFSDSSVKGKKNLIDMRGWRDNFFALTYDPVVSQYRVPKHIGDFHVKQLRNERILNAAKAAIKVHRELISSSAVEELVSYILTIRRQPYTKEYVDAIIEANIPYHMQGGSRYLGSEHRNSDDGVPQLQGNEFFCLRLPAYEKFQELNLAAPPGFHSWQGLRTIASWETFANDKFVLDAKRHVSTLESIYNLIKERVPHSELVDGANTAPWVHGDDGGRSVLLDALVQLKSDLPRVGPVFLTIQGAPKVKRFKEPQKVATDTDNINPEMVKDAVGKGTALDEWLEHGRYYSAEALPTIVRIAKAFVTLRGKEPKNITIPRQNQSAIQTTPSAMADSLSKGIRDAIAARSVMENDVMLVQIAEALENKVDGDEQDIVKLLTDIRAITDATTHASTSGSGRSKKGTPALFTEDQRARGLDSYKQARKDLRDKTSDAAIGEEEKEVFLRTPLLESEVMPSESGALRGDKAANYRIPVKNVTIDRAVSSPVSPFDAQASVIGAAQSFINSRATRQDTMSQGFAASTAPRSGSFRDALRGALSFGQLDSESMDWSTTQATTSPNNVQPPMALLAGPGAMTLFGPWRRRLAFLKNNVPDLVERLVALSILYARNNLHTHIAFAKFGVAFMRLDAWRTGITTESAAIIRLIRGMGTGFTVLSRISVRPGLESVVGDINVTAEFFHGIVFANRHNVNMKPASVLLNHKYGRTNDFMTSPDQMTKSPGEVPACLVMPDSAENHRRDYPAHLFNDNFYYSANKATPSPYRKHGYAAWAQHILGSSVVDQSRSERQRMSYWNVIPRSFVGDRALVYTCGDHGRFDVRKDGTGALGQVELNVGSAYRGFNGHMFPSVDSAPNYVS